MTPARRTLSFARLDQVMPDVDRLLEGHETLKAWSLGQMCNHLSTMIQASVEGFPMKPPWLIRALIGPVARREVFGKGRIREGIRLPRAYVPKPGLDARAEAETLRAAIAYYQSHPEPRAIHPILGRLSNEQWDRLHCLHSAHHLSFAVPR